MSDSHRLKIEIRGETVRLDQRLVQELKSAGLSISRARLKDLFERKQIRIQGIAKSPSWNLLPGVHEIEIFETLSEDRLARVSARGSFIPIAFENDHVLILNKPSGIPSLPLEAGETETAVGSALAHFPRLQGVGRGGLEPGLLHRLDTGTSGLLAFAKTNAIFEQLQDAWKNGSVRKIYRAWVEHPFSSTQKFPQPVDLLLAHHVESRKRMIVVTDAQKDRYRGKPLSTHTVLRRALARREAMTDLEIEITTGVMHQIRCTLAHLGHPVLGDPIYGLDKTGVNRLFLHAWKLFLPIGDRNSLIEITAPPPPEYAQLILR